MGSKLIQNNFSGGELSPRLWGRSDLAAYYRGCAGAENFIVTKEGTLRKRFGVYGTLFNIPLVAGDDVKFFPYRYDQGNGGYLMVFYGGQIEDGGVLKDELKVQFYTDDLVAVGEGQRLLLEAGVRPYPRNFHCKQIGDQMWITGAGQALVVTVTFGGPGGAGTTLSVSTWSQTGRPGGVADGNFRVAHTAGSLNNPRDVHYCAYIVKDGVRSVLNKKSVQMSNPWSAGEVATLTVDVTQAQIDGMDYVGIGKSNSGGGSYGELTRFYREDFPSGTLRRTFDDTNISPGDGIYNQTNVLGALGFGYAQEVDCFQQRKVFANAWSDGTHYPMTLWFSEAGNLDNFMAGRPVSDSDAFSPTIAATGPAFIRWVVAYQEMLVVFTGGGIYSVGCAQSQGFSASSCRITKVSDIVASSSIQPQSCDCGIAFVDSDGRTLYTAAYDLQENMLKPVNRSVLADHLTDGRYIRNIALQRHPYNMVWAAYSDGTFGNFTFERNEEVYAWTHGSLGGGLKVLDIVGNGCVKSGNGETWDSLLFLVEHVVEGVAYKTVLWYNGGTWADNYVGGGAMASHPVVATLTTLPPESRQRTLAGAAKNAKDVTLRLYRTRTLKARTAAEPAAIPLVSADMAGRLDSQGLYTGVVKVMPHGFVNGDGNMVFVSDDANPCEILQVVTELEVGG